MSVLSKPEASLDSFLASVESAIEQRYPSMHELAAFGSRGKGNRILVGMLYSGERQLRSAVKALATQEGVAITVAVFAGFSNRDAHHRLYEHFMVSSEQFEYFAKVDADMVLSSSSSLADACRTIELAGADHGVFAVQDWLSLTPIHGVNVTRSHARWEFNPHESLFVDPEPVNMHRRIIVNRTPAPLAAHNPDPADSFAYRFGVHRSLKVRQSGRPTSFRCRQAFDQFDLLKAIYAAACAEPHRKRYLALEGSRRVLASLVPARLSTYRSPLVDTWFRQANELSTDELRHRIERFWGSPTRLRLVAAESRVRCLVQARIRSAVAAKRWLVERGRA